MLAARYNRNLSGTPSKTTLPFRLTNQTSANLNLPCLSFHHHHTLRMTCGAQEFVTGIVELLEQTGGLAASARTSVRVRNGQLPTLWQEFNNPKYKLFLPSA